jgi:branched-chain amino acid transport system substrate-binding protein
MRSSVLARSRARVRARALTAAAGVILVAGLVGCAAAANTTVSVTGTNLTIYASASSSTASSSSPVDQQSQDVLDAEQLALQQAGGAVGKFKIKLVRLEGSEASDNARTAIGNTSTIAYLGEISPGSSQDSAGITNAQDVLQISPTDTALELTEATAAVSGAPNRYYESLKTYGKTFGRVVPNTAVEAKAQVQEMQSLGVKQLYVANDGSQYGAAIARAVKTDASPAITVVGTQAGADGVFYGASSGSAADRVFNAAAQSSASVKLFGPSALDNQTFASGLAPGTRHVYISAPGFLDKDLPPAGQKFLTDFKTAYNRTPAPQAIFGYAAMSAALTAIRDAGSSANNRSDVVKGFFALRNQTSVLGSYSINANGDTSLTQFVFNRMEAGKLVPFKPVSAQG